MKDSNPLPTAPIRQALQPGGKFEYMRAEYNSIYGRVSCGWKKTDGEYKYEIVIPPNCTADILLPGGISQTAESGHYII